VNHRNTQLLALGGVAVAAWLLWRSAGAGSKPPAWVGLDILFPDKSAPGYAVKEACPFMRYPILNTYRSVDNSDSSAGNAKIYGVGHIQSKVSGWGYLTGMGATTGLSCNGEALDAIQGDMRACALLAYIAALCPTLDLSWPDLSPPDLTPLSARGLSASIAVYPDEGLQPALRALGATCVVHGPDFNSHKVDNGVSVGIVGTHRLSYPRLDICPMDRYLKGVYLDNG